MYHFYFKSFKYILGNDALHMVTSQREYELRVDMTDNKGQMGHAHYDTFVVGDEESNYKLTVLGYSGNVGEFGF